MTKTGRRARCFERRQERLRRRPLLSLVAMMDVFTILVFFLLANYSDVLLSAERNTVRLPESYTGEAPRDSLVVTVTPQAILLGGARVARVNAVLKASEIEIEGLRSALLRRDGEKSSARLPSPDGVSQEITIMADKAIPFRVLKKVMVTCTGAGYGRISLSVLQRSLRSG
jgi:biopolymer transport protein TolR